MAKIKNMGSATMKFNEGIIVSGSANNNESVIVTGSIVASENVIVEEKIGVRTSTPIAELDVSGSIAITSEITTPSQPASGQGFIYSKSDGKLYWRSHDLAETELTAGGGSSTIKHYATGHCDLTTGNKPTNWVNASSVSAANAIKTWFIVPYTSTLDRIIVTVKGNNFSTSNDGNITLSVFKNQTNYGSTIVNQTVGADNFTEKVSNMAGGSTDCNQKVFAGLNQSLSEGDLIQVKVSKSAGSDKEALVTMIFEG